MSDPRELLDAYAGSTVYLGGNGEYSADTLTPATFAALRAVLDLHDVCTECVDGLNPCSTVQAITKALEES